MCLYIHIHRANVAQQDYTSCWTIMVHLSFSGVSREARNDRSSFIHPNAFLQWSVSKGMRGNGVITLRVFSLERRSYSEFEKTRYRPVIGLHILEIIHASLLNNFQFAPSPPGHDIHRKVQCAKRVLPHYFCSKRLLSGSYHSASLGGAVVRHSLTT